MDQLPEGNTEWDIAKTIELQISEGPEPTTEPTTEPTQPAEVTKDVVIDLKGEADNDDTHVVVRMNGTLVFDETVSKGTKTITIPGQTGTGTVTYDIMVNDSEGWSQDVVFTN